MGANCPALVRVELNPCLYDHVSDRFKPPLICVADLNPKTGLYYIWDNECLEAASF